MSQASVNLKTDLNGRVLCADGDSIVKLPFLYTYVLDGGKVSELFLSKKDANSEEVKSYNKKYPDDQITYKKSLKELSTKWKYPEKYGNIDLDEYILSKFKHEVKSNSLSKDDIRQRYYRVQMELRLWKDRQLTDMLRCLIYIVDTFREKKIVWGTGRGSSCASYILYLIGLHQIDSVMYDLDISEFFR